VGLMDRVKAQASQLAQMTQDAAQEGRAKLDQAQAGRRADGMLRQLGIAVLAERTGRGATDTQATIDKLVADISAYEQANGVNLVAAAAQVGPQPGFAQGQQGGTPGQQSSPFPGAEQSPFPGAEQSPFPGAEQSPFPGAQQNPFPNTGTTSFADSPQFFPAPDSSEAPSGE
jgi:hypothetical protein